MRWEGILYMLLSVFLFTAANVCVKVIGYLPTPQLVFLRSSISLVICASYVIYKGFPFFGYNRGWLLIRGIFGMIALTMFFYTIQNIPLASATVIQYLSPVFTVILAKFFLKEKVRPIRWFFLAIAFAGIILVKGFDPRVPMIYLIIGGIAAFFAAVAYFATMKCRETDHPVAIVMYFHLLAVPIMGTWSATIWEPIGFKEWGIGMLIGVLSVFAQIAMAVAITREDASIVTPIKYVGAILALLIGMYWFNEHLNAMSILGIFLVIFGVSLNTILKNKKT